MDTWRVVTSRGRAGCSLVGETFHLISMGDGMFKSGSIQDGKTIIVGVVAALGGIAPIIWAFVYLTPLSAPVGSGNAAPEWGALDRWQAMGMLIVALGIAFGVAAMLRFALAPLIAEPSSSAAADANTALRSRIAPIVLSIGSIAIVVLALGLIIAFVYLSVHHAEIELQDGTIRQILPNQRVAEKIDTLLTGVFTSILPVVATWVGTVLAFYFGSENFRQAADSTRGAMNDRQPVKKTIADVMIPYDRIASVFVDHDEDAPKVPMADVIHTMSEAATRVVVFNKKNRTPLHIIRSAVPPMPKNWITADFKTTDETGEVDAGGKPKPNPKTIQDYLNENATKNAADAKSFRFVAANVTPEDVLALMSKQKVDDVFITQNGQETSPVLGWVASHDLRKK
jgi:hypothetical protein